MRDKKQFSADERGVSEVIGAILVFGLLVALLAIMQTQAVPAANQEVEFNHMTDVQNDLQQMRSDLLDSSEGNDLSSVSVKLGTEYPSRLLFFSHRAATGSLQTEPVSDISSSSVNFTKVCGTGSSGTVSTKHIVYDSNYNYLQTDTEQVYENTVLYQSTEDGEEHLLQSGQSFILPESKTINLYPIQGNLSEQTSRSVSLEFIGGETGKITYSNPSISVPSNISDTQWESMISDSDVSTNTTGDTVDFSFTGDWTVKCQPVGINQAPEQTLEPVNEDEDSIDSPGVLNPAGDDVVTLTNVESQSVAGFQAGMSLTFTNNAGSTRVWDEARLAHFSAGDSNTYVEIGENSMDQLYYLEPFQNVNSNITIAPNDTRSVDLGLSKVFQTNGNFLVLQIRYDNGEMRSYIVGNPGFGIDI